MTTTPKVYLIQTPKRLKDGRVVAYYIVRWPDSNGKYREESIGRTKATGGTVTARDAEAARRAKELALGTGEAPRDRLETTTLEAFTPFYIDRRKHSEQGTGYRKGAHGLKRPTLAKHSMTLRYMAQHFGPTRRLDAIDADDAERFIAALEAGTLAAAREARQTYTLTTETVRGHIRNCKAIFAWAKSRRIIHVNPFDDFNGAPGHSRPNHYLPLADFERLLSAVDSPGWRVFYALQRLAGLRRGEAVSLPWDGEAADSDGVVHRVGIDFGRRRVCIVGNAKTVHRYREVPICPRLLTLLNEAREAAGGDDASGTVCGLPAFNLTRRAQAHIERAGLTAWAKVYQSIRSSCENDWKMAGFAEATYAAWIGHSPTVSRKHYVAPTPGEFDAVTAPETRARLVA
ncbi:MAG: hypothetical protein HRU76_00040 [Phycisphaeraceae bacterium]|nr:hypothetical protein [Phycisphaerales bacterium]QOJ16082.1 MAG: hypothetical protein HRU76_00040 [Phycisphaeraceae bacterium]